jgi:hypothetical protein
MASVCFTLAHQREKSSRVHSIGQAAHPYAIRETIDPFHFAAYRLHYCRLTKQWSSARAPLVHRRMKNVIRPLIGCEAGALRLPCCRLSVRASSGNTMRGAETRSFSAIGIRRHHSRDGPNNSTQMTSRLKSVTVAVILSAIFSSSTSTSSTRSWGDSPALLTATELHGAR